MSLVNEALKKARMEAARGDAAKSGIPYPALGRGQRPSSGPWTPILAAVLLLLVGLGGIFLYRAGRQSALTPTSEGPLEVAKAGRERGSGGEAKAATSKAGSAAGDPVPAAEHATVANTGPPLRRNRSAAQTESAPAGLTSEPGTAARLEPPAVGPDKTQERPRAAAAKPEPLAARERPSRPALEGPSAAEPAPTESDPDSGEGPEPTSPAVPAVPQPAAEYLRSAEIAGVGPIELGGIAWSGDRPFALVNGRVVRPGDSVLGLMIEEIQPNTVRLRGDLGDVILKLK